MESNSNRWLGISRQLFVPNQEADENRTASATAPFFFSTRPLNVLQTGAAAPNTPATFSERFRLHVIDVAGTHKWTSGPNSVVLSAGVRIAPSRQVYTARDTFGAGTPETVTYTQKRTGWGPTVGLDVRQKIGPLWWTSAGRIAFLFGKIDESATYTGVALPAGSPLGSATRNLSRTTPVWEGETGLEWATGCCGGGQFFVNGSFILHHWHNLVNVVPTPAAGAVAFSALDNPAAAHQEGQRPIRWRIVLAGLPLLT